MILKNQGATEKDIYLKIYNDPVIQNEKTDFIGVITDCSLTWNEHISYHIYIYIYISGR